MSNYDKLLIRNLTVKDMSNDSSTFKVESKSDNKVVAVSMKPEHVAQIIGQYLERQGQEMADEFVLCVKIKDCEVRLNNIESFYSQVYVNYR